MATIFHIETIDLGAKDLMEIMGWKSKTRNFPYQPKNEDLSNHRFINGYLSISRPLHKYNIKSIHLINTLEFKHYRSLPPLIN